DHRHHHRRAMIFLDDHLHAVGERVIVRRRRGGSHVERNQHARQPRRKQETAHDRIDEADVTADSMFSFLKSDKGEAKDSDWRARLKRGLELTRNVLNTDLGELLRKRTTIDESLYEELETLLIASDVGVGATQWLLDTVRARAKRERFSDPA